MAKQQAEQEDILYHADGSVWARGPMRGELMSGYWEWYRKDGTRLRSGHFEDGKQVGEWTTYDKAGAVYKVTVMGEKPGAKAPARKVAKKAAPKVAKKAAKKSVEKVVKKAAKKKASRK